MGSAGGLDIVEVASKVRSWAEGKEQSGERKLSIHEGSHPKQTGTPAMVFACKCVWRDGWKTLIKCYFLHKTVIVHVWEDHLEDQTLRVRMREPSELTSSGRRRQGADASLLTPSLASLLYTPTALLNKHEPDRTVIDLPNTSIISHSLGLQVWIKTDDNPLTVGGRLSPCQPRAQQSQRQSSHLIPV